MMRRDMKVARDEDMNCTSVAVTVAVAARRWSAATAMVLPKAIRALDFSEYGAAGRLST